MKDEKEKIISVQGPNWFGADWNSGKLCNTPMCALSIGYRNVETCKKWWPTITGSGPKDVQAA